MPASEKEKNDSEISQSEICSQEKVKEAINVLKLLEEKFVEKDLKKQPLLENTAECFIFLQIILKKIPPPHHLKMIRVPLPHSLMTGTSEVCLITGDLEKRNHKAEIEPTVLHYKDLLKKHGVTNVTQVIPLRQLRTEYKTFESKRQLAAAYDVFLVDKKIAGVLPKVLGKTFFHSRKFPIQINMKKMDLKEEIDKVLCQANFSLTCRGNSYALEIARLSMKNDAILQNIMTSVHVLTNTLPGKENNILGLYLKAAKSKAIPIYMSLDTADDILIKKKLKNKKIGLDELSTFDDAEVKVFRDGTVKLLKQKKKSSSHEDAAEDGKYMNSNDTRIKKEEDTQEAIASEVPSKKKKSRKINDLNEITDNTELENKEYAHVAVSDKRSVKKKKGRNNACLDHQVVANSHVENEGIQISSKKKGKYIADNASNNKEDNQNNHIHKVSSKKNKKNLDSNHVEAPKELKENRVLLKSKKQKLQENDDSNEKAQKFKGKKILENEENGKIGKRRQSKLFEEHVNVKNLKSKKAENGKDVIDAAKIEASLTEILQNEKTPLKSNKKKRKH